MGSFSGEHVKYILWISETFHTVSGWQMCNNPLNDMNENLSQQYTWAFITVKAVYGNSYRKDS